MISLNIDSYIHPISFDDQDIDIPESFTFPFYYEPHSCVILAKNNLLQLIDKELFKVHNFGLNKDENGIGKMFGVLVIKKPNGQFGFLAAFSGKLGNSNEYEGFVPPIFDTCLPTGFYKVNEADINQVNASILEIENNEDLLNLKSQLHKYIIDTKHELNQLHNTIKIKKADRDSQRNKNAGSPDYELFESILSDESKKLSYQLKKFKKEIQFRTLRFQEQINGFENQIKYLKDKRKKMSHQLQIRLFEEYQFLNSNKESKSLLDIFQCEFGEMPPSGAGECAAPKLLQFAFRHNLKIIAMGEFWYGKSPNSEIRKHGLFYASCKSKCEPILSFMLSGIKMDKNPMLENNSLVLQIEIIYEDEHMAILNKPCGLLSVPGKQISDSVYTRMREKYGKSCGPLIIHRLDMSTSGIMLIAKTKKVHQNLQHQFLFKKIKKRYIAILDGQLESNGGQISLPLRVDLEDRPKQLVCYKYGKDAITFWEVISRSNNNTRVYFYPVSGRTHQLRVHAAHQLGLNSPIKGDDLYGKKGVRLYLHAESITFFHPIFKNELNFTIEPEF